MHVASVEGGLSKELLEFHLRQECIPKSVGGLWDENYDFQTWIKGREEKEMNLMRKMFPLGLPKEESEDPVTETVQNKEKALRALEEAINLMEDDEKKDYLEAKRVVPNLILTESNPLWFIRCEKWNTWAAARRVAFYWKKRKEYFGSRAHLPMNQSGEGALSKDDVALLSTGYICLLPRDAKGRDVICHDASRKPPGMIERRLRVLFYMGNILAENKKNQTEGSRFLVVLSKISLDGGFTKTMEIAKEVLPSINFDVHIVHVPGQTSKTTFVEKFVPRMLQILGSFLEDKTVIHANETKSALLERLESYDFERYGLPVTVGGKWTYDQFYYWQEARIRMEWDLPLSAAQRKLVFEGDKYTCRGMSQLDDDEKIERKRRLNLLHSRRKREKEKVEVEVLKSQVSRLEDEKHEANIERERLQKLLADAYDVLGHSMHRQQSGLGGESASMSVVVANEFHSDTDPSPRVPNHPSSYDARNDAMGICYSTHQADVRAAQARFYNAMGAHHGRSMSPMTAMNPQSPEADRMQQVISTRNWQQQLQQQQQQQQQQQLQQQRQQLYRQQIQNVMAAPNLDYFVAQGPVLGVATGTSFASNHLYTSQTNTTQQQQQQQQQQYECMRQQRESQLLSYSDDPYSMRLDPNESIKRRRY